MRMLACLCAVLLCLSARSEDEYYDPDYTPQKTSGVIVDVYGNELVVKLDENGKISKEQSQGFEDWYGTQPPEIQAAFDSIANVYGEMLLWKNEFITSISNSDGTLSWEKGGSKENSGSGSYSPDKYYVSMDNKGLFTLKKGSGTSDAWYSGRALDGKSITTFVDGETKMQLAGWKSDGTSGILASVLADNDFSTESGYQVVVRKGKDGDLVYYDIGGGIGMPSWVTNTLSSATNDIAVMNGYTNAITAVATYTNVVIDVTNRVAILESYTNKIDNLESYTNTIVETAGYTNVVIATTNTVNELTTYTNTVVETATYTNRVIELEPYTNYVIQATNDIEELKKKTVECDEESVSTNATGTASSSNAGKIQLYGYKEENGSAKNSDPKLPYIDGSTGLKWKKLADMFNSSVFSLNSDGKVQIKTSDGDAAVMQIGGSGTSQSVTARKIGGTLTSSDTLDVNIGDLTTGTLGGYLGGSGTPPFNVLTVETSGSGASATKVLKQISVGTHVIDLSGISNRIENVEAYTNRVVQLESTTNRITALEAYTNAITAVATYTNVVIDVTNRVAILESYTNKIDNLESYTNTIVETAGYTNVVIATTNTVNELTTYTNTVVETATYTNRVIELEPYTNYVIQATNDIEELKKLRGDNESVWTNSEGRIEIKGYETAKDGSDIKLPIINGSTELSWASLASGAFDIKDDKLTIKGLGSGDGSRVMVVSGTSNPDVSTKDFDGKSIKIENDKINIGGWSTTAASSTTLAGALSSDTTPGYNVLCRTSSSGGEAIYLPIGHISQITSFPEPDGMTIGTKAGSGLGVTNYCIVGARSSANEGKFLVSGGESGANKWMSFHEGSFDVSTNDTVSIRGITDDEYEPIDGVTVAGALTNQSVCAEFENYALVVRNDYEERIDYVSLGDVFGVLTNLTHSATGGVHAGAISVNGMVGTNFVFEAGENTNATFTPVNSNGVIHVKVDVFWK